jgi:hypothetical protein
MNPVKDRLNILKDNFIPLSDDINMILWKYWWKTQS